MKSTTLHELLGNGQFGANLMCSARVMLSRGQSNCAMDIIVAGLSCAGITDWDKHGITNKGIFEALER